MKVANLSNPVQPNSVWTIFFTAPNGTEYFVDMSTAAVGTAAVFEYGHPRDPAIRAVAMPDAILKTGDRAAARSLAEYGFAAGNIVRMDKGQKGGVQLFRRPP